MDLVNLFKKTPLVYISLAFIFGLILGEFFSSDLGVIILFTIGLCLLFTKKDTIFVFGILVCLLSFGAHRMQTTLILQNHYKSVANEFHDNIVAYQGDIAEIKQTKKGFKYRLHLFDFQNIDIWLYQKTRLNCDISDTLIGQGEFQRISPARNPGEFDFQSFYNRRNIYGWIFPDKNEHVTILKNNHFHFGRFISEIQEKIRTHFNEHAPGDAGGLLSALILGDKSDVAPDIRDSFVNTGVIHVLAVSGLHVGYVLIVLLLIKNMFRLPWGLDRIVVILGLIIFVILTGGKASVIRASIMAGLYVMAPVFNRSANIWNIIGGAALGILCFRPMDLFDLGFQLSFLAVGSIIFFYNWFETVLPDKLKVSKISHKALQFIWGLFLVSLAAQVGTLPLTSYVFGKLPLIALIANVLIVPLIGVLVGIGFFLLFLGWIPGMGFVLGNSAWLISKIITFFTHTFSMFSFSTININFSLFLVVIYFLVLGSMVFLFDKRKRKYGLYIIIIVLNISVWKWSFNDRKLDVIFLDVGQGDAAIVRLPNKKVMLIDTGPRSRYEDMGKDVVLPLLNHLGINKLDWVVMTHPHSDHIGGLVSIVNEIEIDTLWDTFIPYTSRTYQTIIDFADSNGIIINRPRSGETKRLSENVYLLVLAPDSLFAVTERNVNNASIVFKLVYGETSILFTGDLEHEGDELLIPYQQLLKSDVLKVAHHGSITSSTDAFLDLVNPALSVISVGWKNKFRHPSPIVLERFRSREIDVHRTDLNGALWIQSDGKNIKEVKWN
ncbi:MAG: DNA internalization-related competence protein ComEC/Rec2 [Candidatus Marinimicrobia bacterium]|nr:DNA internalization-related competence protein ComEC/Rec2 [Candidatus Neomarinimicrobiota bacterium]